MDQWLIGHDVDGQVNPVVLVVVLHGVAQTLSFPAEVSTSGEHLDASAEFVVDRQDFGVSYPGKPEDLIQGNLVFTIGLSGMRTGS